ncbi:MMPL family transporter [Halalkalibacter urbisdiaboli]|uniref:MMPL family transporter n=1 Tax=Halalkalibacter urbisdiaboli TaxID=1960589 RepID=UPI000B44135A|nr:MMPL family transporter [Halalkalibacter urbisdiaboli]
MKNVLGKIGGSIVKFRWFILCFWVVATIIGGVYGSQLAPALTGGGWDVPNADSTTAASLIDDHVEGRSETNLTFVIKDTRYQVGSNQYEENLEKVKKFLLDEPEISQVVTILDVSEEMKSQFQGTDAYTSLGFIEMDIDAGFAQKALPDIQERLDQKAEQLAIEVVLLGAPAFWGEISKISQEGLEHAHLYALPIIVVVLLFVFRTVISALTPLVLSITSIVITSGLLFGITHLTELSVFAQDSAMMIGLGVGIDFALVFVMRFKEEIARATVKDAIEKTMSTAGHAILFSGITIIGTMAMILFVEVAAIRSIALGIIVVVFLLLLTSLTLLPAFLAIIGIKINALKIPFQTSKGGGGKWYRLSRRVMRRPILYLAGAVFVLLSLSWPALQLETASSDVRILPDGSNIKQGVEQLQDGFGLGYTSPIQVVVHLEDKKATDVEVLQQVDSLINRIRLDENVEGVTSILSFFEGVDKEFIRLALDEGQIDEHTRRQLQRYVNESQNTLIIEIVTKHYASSDETKALVTELRENMVPNAISDALVVVGGETAQGMDTNESLSHSLKYVLIYTLVFIFVVLMITFKSILLPLKAVMMNLLSLSATYGVVVAVFNWGWGGDLLGFGDYGMLQELVPILLLGLLFSLSTDYEVFLLERVKEEFEESNNSDESVAIGLEKTAPMISGAALIMVAVFGSFAFAGILPMQQLGLGMAVAIALDATIVRLFLVPATMKLLGKWNWWFPGKKQSWEEKIANKAVS